MSKSNDQLIATIDRFENGFGVLDFGHGQMLTLAKRFLPKDSKEGDALNVDLLTDTQVTKRREHLAKAMLEEILGGE